MFLENLKGVPRKKLIYCLRDSSFIDVGTEFSMGAATSKIEDDKALILCQERKRFVKAALDGRCLLAATHFAYIQSLRSTGTALRKFIEPDVPTESSLYTSTSATPEPLSLMQKSFAQLSNLSPSLSQNVDTSASFSPVPSPRSPGRFHVNHMKASKSSSTVVEEKTPIPMMATLRTSGLDDNSSFEAPEAPPHGTPPWDYFGLLHPDENHFSFQDGRAINHRLDNADDIKRLREEEGIPELEEEGEKSSANGRDDFAESEDDFDNPSSEPLVQMFKNRNVFIDQKAPAVPSTKSFASETEHLNEEKNMLGNGMSETSETPVMTPSKGRASAAVLPITDKLKDPGSDIKYEVQDFYSCMKEIENLFSRASESGREIPRMLEADTVHFRPIFHKETVRGSETTFLTACFACCTEEVPHPQIAAPTEIKNHAWHRSLSSHSSSSRNPLEATSKDGVDNIFGGICMNSGSHASTLDRLYAWERKLYDEVKASGSIRREYDIKCRLLRHQESRAESQYRVDKTRAAVKDLHSRIRVAIHRINLISKKIKELKDRELQPQLEELIGGLTRMWSAMLDCHRHQYDIILAASNNGSAKLSIESESQRQAAILLEAELNALCSNFTKWISSHKSYLQSINSWLLKCIFSTPKQKSSKRRNDQSSRQNIAPPIFITCQDWLKLLDELPTMEVADAIKDLVTVTTRFLPHQDKRRKDLNLSFKLPRNGGPDHEPREHHKNDSPIAWSLNCDSLQSGLVVFLGRLRNFAESSLEKYEGLQKSINRARETYENGGYGGG